MSASPTHDDRARGDSWTVIGAGSALPRAGFGPSGHALRLAALDGVTLFDCGPGTVRALDAAGIALVDVRRVVITHFHVDHCADLAALAFARRNPTVPSPPLEVLAPPAIDGVLDGLRAAFGKHATFADTTVRHLVHGVEHGVEHGDGRGDAGIALGPEDAGVRLRWTPNGHTKDAVSVAVDVAGAPLVAYTGDTGPDPRVARLAAGARLFVAECSFPDGAGSAAHLTPRTAGHLAREAGAARLLLTHFYPMLEPADARAAAAEVFDGPIETARDGSLHRP